MDAREFLGLLLRKRWWLIVGMLTSTAGFTAAAYLIRPVYRASLVMIPVSSERNSLAGTLGASLGQLGGGIASLAGLNTGSNDPVTQEAMGLLRSRAFGEQFIIDKNLLPELFPRRWDAKQGNWKASPDGPPTVNRGFNYFDKKIRTVTLDAKTGLTTLQIDWRDRVAAAEWANELVKRLNAEMRTRAIANANASVEFLEKELQTTTVVETRAAINRLIETQEKQKMLATVTAEFAYRIVDPAISPDQDDPEKPPKELMLAAGPVVGLLLAIACVLLFGVGDDVVSSSGPHPAGS